MWQEQVAMALLCVFGALSVACSSDDDAGPTGPCAQRSGTYRMTFVEQSGNCGDMPEQISTITEQPQTAKDVDPSCTGTIGYSDDNCVVTVDTTCPGATGYLVVQRGEATWSTDGSTGTATLQLMLLREADKYGECSSVYRVTYRRI